METAQPLLAGRLPTLQLENKEPKARHQCSDQGHVAPHLPGKNTSSSFMLAVETNPSWFRLTSLRSSSRLRKQQQTPTWKHKRLLTLVKGSQKACWVYHKAGCVHLRSCSSQIMWETTYLGNLCDFIKYFE